MEILSSPESRVAENIRTAVTVGTFDGLHIGHRAILEQLRDSAAERRLSTLIVTFEPHPRHVLFPDNPFGLLTSLEAKTKLFSSLGIDYLAVLEFDHRMAAMETDDFVERYLIERFGMDTLVIGYDGAFGRDRNQSEKQLEQMADAGRFRLRKVDPVLDRGVPVSSSRIRDLLLEAELEEAAENLGRSYSFDGRVISGAGRGRKLGFPTANLETDWDRIRLFPDGIYVVCANVRGSLKKGLLHCGPRPTFGEKERTLELLIFDFEDDIYGETIEVFLLKRIRPIEHYRSAQELIDRMDRDVEEAVDYFEKIDNLNKVLGLNGLSLERS